MSAARTADITGDAAEVIRSWLIGRVAFYLERPPTEVDPARSLVELGLDSIYALTLCGDVEEQFDLMVEPTMAWDYPTVDAIAGYLTGELAGKPGTG